MCIEKEMSKVRLAVRGSPYHENLVKSFLDDVRNVELLDTDWFSRDIDIFYWIYGFPTFLLKTPIFWMSSKPLLIIHWVGSDVLRTFLTPQDGARGKIVRLMVKSALKIRSSRIVNLAVSGWLVSELKSQGISASCFPLSTLDIKTLKAPNEIEDKDIDFLSYIPKASFAFYGGSHILRLSRELPQYTFAVIMPDIIDRKTLPRSPFDNLRFYPRLTFEEMQDMYLRSKCLNRLTEHDGLPLTVLEALYYKLKVVWTYDFPYVIRVKRDDIDVLKKLLSSIVENYIPNNGGHNYVIQNFSREVWRREFLKLLRTFNRHFGHWDIELI